MGRLGKGRAFFIELVKRAIVQGMSGKLPTDNQMMRRLLLIMLLINFLVQAVGWG